MTPAEPQVDPRKPAPAWGWIIVAMGWLSVPACMSAVSSSNASENAINVALVLWGGALAGSLVLLLGAMFMRSGVQGLLTLAGAATAFIAGASTADFSSGRPLRRGKRVVLPEVVGGATESAAAQAWLEDARAEHASVPAFAELSVALTAAGAPYELIARAHFAALEEIDHARRCFELASAYAGTEQRAGRMPGEADGLERLALESIRDGMIGEGFAARIAAERAARSDAPDVKATLGVIATDEASHAALARDVLGFCLQRGGEPLARAVRRELPRLPESTQAPRDVDAERAQALYAEVRSEVFRDVERLLGAGVA